MPESKLVGSDMHRDIGLHMRADSINVDARTIECVFATETPVKQYSYELGGYYMEVLSMNKEHIRQDRLKSKGMAVLDTHDRWSITRQYGVVEDYQIGKQCTATLRFSKRQEAEGVWQDVQDKIVRNVTCGYRVYKYMDMNPNRKTDEMPIYKAIDWEPTEISLTPVQADVKSLTRSEKEGSVHDIVIITDKQNLRTDMTPEEIQAAIDKRVDEAIERQRSLLTSKKAEGGVEEPIDVEKLRSEGQKAERKRVSDIQEAIKFAKITDGEFERKLIEDGTEIDQARALIIQKFADADPNAGQRSIVIETDEVDKRRELMVNAVLVRSANSQFLPKEVRENRNTMAEIHRNVDMSLFDMCRMAVEDEGQNVRGMSKSEIIGRALSSSTSDFPILMSGAYRTILLGAYSAAPDVWRKFAKVGSVVDFRPHHRIRSGSISNLDKVAEENAEYRTKALSDGEKETIYAETYGNIVNISRKMIINDDLNAFTDIASQMGRASARTIEQAVFDLLTSNALAGPTMGDGVALFHTNHGNIGTGDAPTAATLDALKVLMANQKDPSSNDWLNIRPSIVVCPLGLASTFRILNESKYDVDATNKLQKPNVVNGMFTDIVDTPRLSGTAFYLFASPMDNAVLEVAFLNGVETPYMEQNVPFTQDGLQWKIRHDWGVGAIGWRGVIYDAGA